MSFLFSNDFILIPIFGIAVFIAAHFSANRIIKFFLEKSLGSREEVMRLMDLMFIETDKKKVTTLLLLASFGMGCLLFALLWPNVIFGLIVGLAVTVVGWQVPKVFMNQLWESRCNKVVDQMVDGMTIMGNGIRAGLSITQSMERVVQNMNGPLPQEFSLVLNKVRLGMTVEDALNELADRIPRQDMQMFVTAVVILKETGGNLAETFTTIVTTVRERQKVEKKIQALTAQGTMQAIIITLVPFILLGLFLVMDPKYVEPLFTKPLGWVALLSVLGLQVIGGVMMKKIVTIKV